MASLTFKHIYKKYPGKPDPAVNDFNLEIKDGEFVIFVGPSGCGKSTTLRMIAGLEEITEGELFIGNRLVNDVAPKDRDIAMVFQNYALYPHMTVFDNMAFGLKLRKVPKETIKRKVEEAAKMLGIDDLLQRKPKAMSGGQKQRVALGRAIVRDPAVFLLDEPLSNLDAKLRAQMRFELTKIHRDLGTTFVYVTHDQVEAMTMATRIVVMKGGITQQVDTPQNLYDYPVNKFVAGFIGTPQMNFVDGILEMRGDKLYFHFGEGGFLLLPDTKNEQLKPYIGKEVTLGIRPECLFVDPAELSKYRYSVIDTTVEVTELMGAEIYLYVSCEGQNMVARIQPRAMANVEDGCVKVAVDTSRVHVFDKETEVAIAHFAQEDEEGKDGYYEA